MTLQVSRRRRFFFCEASESGEWDGAEAGFVVALTYEAVKWAAAGPGLLTVCVERRLVWDVWINFPSL